jgi:dihydropyrimidine dehydrogenase (NADP+)
VQVSTCHTDPATGRVRLVEFERSYEGEDGIWHTDPEQTAALKVDHVISAFGSVLSDESVQRALSPVTLNRWGLPEVDACQPPRQSYPAA